MSQCLYFLHLDILVRNSNWQPPAGNTLLFSTVLFVLVLFMMMWDSFPYSPLGIHPAFITKVKDPRDLGQTWADANSNL